MTYEEQQQYNKLPSDKKDEYNFVKSKNPTWSHERIIKRLGVTDTIEDMLNRGIDVDPNDPGVLKEILLGAKKMLTNLGIVIDSLVEAFDGALSILGTIIDSGVRYIGDRLKDFWDWLME